MSEGPDVAGLLSLASSALAGVAGVAPFGVVLVARWASAFGDLLLLAFVLVPLLSCPLLASLAIGAGLRASRGRGSLPGRVGAGLGALVLLAWVALLAVVFVGIPAFLLF